ncbi:MAG: hypothetical protein M1826_005100 [Phylliscum demangeonii]|nr:MAG: hypothetical protein M1826_005100 [Phylliscum demangeonii]
MKLRWSSARQLLQPHHRLRFSDPPTSSSAATRRYAAPPPSMRRGQPRPLRPPPAPELNPDPVAASGFAALTNLWSEAHRARYLNPPPRNTIAFLESVAALGAALTPEKLEEAPQAPFYATDANWPASTSTPPSAPSAATLHETDVPRIAQVLLRSSDARHYPLVKRLQVAASGLGVREATYHLVSAGLKRQRLSLRDMQQPVAHLAQLAARGADPQALVLWGRVQVARGEDRAAMHAFEEALRQTAALEPSAPADERAATSGADPAAAGVVAVAVAVDFFGATPAVALVELARLRWKHCDPDAAAEAYWHAAEAYDDATAWLELAKIQPLGSVHYPRFLARAAARNNLEAAQRLAQYYLWKSREGDGSSPAAKEAGAWAREWFAMGSTPAVVPSQDEVGQMMEPESRPGEWRGTTPGAKMTNE